MSIINEKLNYIAFLRNIVNCRYCNTIINDEKKKLFLSVTGVPICNDCFEKLKTSAHVELYDWSTHTIEDLMDFYKNDGIELYAWKILKEHKNIGFFIDIENAVKEIHFDHGYSIEVCSEKENNLAINVRSIWKEFLEKILNCTMCKRKLNLTNFDKNYIIKCGCHICFNCRKEIFQNEILEECQIPHICESLKTTYHYKDLKQFLERWNVYHMVIQRFVLHSIEDLSKSNYEDLDDENLYAINH